MQEAKLLWSFDTCSDEAEELLVQDQRLFMQLMQAVEQQTHNTDAKN